MLNSIQITVKYLQKIVQTITTHLWVVIYHTQTAVQPLFSTKYDVIFSRKTKNVYIEVVNINICIRFKSIVETKKLFLINANHAIVFWMGTWNKLIMTNCRLSSKGNYHFRQVYSDSGQHCDIEKSCFVRVLEYLRLQKNVLNVIWW